MKGFSLRLALMDVNRSRRNTLLGGIYGTLMSYYPESYGDGTAFNLRILLSGHITYHILFNLQLNFFQQKFKKHSHFFSFFSCPLYLSVFLCFFISPFFFSENVTYTKTTSAIKNMIFRALFSIFFLGIFSPALSLSLSLSLSFSHSLYIFPTYKFLSTEINYKQS